jgi:hypothetical protein
MFLEEQADIPWPALLYVTGIMQNAKMLSIHYCPYYAFYSHNKNSYSHILKSPIF